MAATPPPSATTNGVNKVVQRLPWTAAAAAAAAAGHASAVGGAGAPSANDRWLTQQPSTSLKRQSLLLPASSC